jgi:hypothetical protein
MFVLSLGCFPPQDGDHHSSDIGDTASDRMTDDDASKAVDLCKLRGKDHGGNNQATICHQL